MNLQGRWWEEGSPREGERRRARSYFWGLPEAPEAREKTHLAGHRCVRRRERLASGCVVLWVAFGRAGHACS
jgi:hypothetical protein